MTPDVEGDWVVRKDAPTEQLLAALEPIVKDQTQSSLGFAEQQVDAIVKSVPGIARARLVEPEPAPTLHQAAFELGLVHLEEGREIPHARQRAPGVLVEQEVVALDHHVGGFGAYLLGPGDGDLARAVEDREVH